jgi:hypothetical protein
VFFKLVDGFDVNECVSNQSICHRATVLCAPVSETGQNAESWDVSSRCVDSDVKGPAYACSRSFVFNSYLILIFVWNIVVRREISSVLDVGMDSSGCGERVDVIEVGELGADPGEACLLSEERVLIIPVAFLRVVRKSSTVGVMIRGAQQVPSVCAHL